MFGVHDNTYYELGAYKHRVKVLEAAIKQFADPNNWNDAIACLQWVGKRHAIEYANEVLVTGCVGE